MAYKVSLTIGNETINMYPLGQQGSGYPAILVATIDGWTGMEANISKSATMNGIGETVTAKTIGGRTMQFKGYILDGNDQTQFAAKLNMLRLLQPNTAVTVTFTPLNTVAAQGVVTLTGDAIVKASPTITQEKHSRFVFDLYFPFPYLRTAVSESIELTENLNASVSTIAKTEAPTPYTFTGTVKSGGKLKEFTLYGSGGNISIRCDLSKIVSTGYLSGGDQFMLTCDYDKASLDIVASGNTARSSNNQCIDLTSTFWLLPVGATGFRVETTPADGVSGNQLVNSKGVISYTPLRLATMLSEV